MSKRLYSELELTIRTNDYDENDQLRPDAILDYFQMIAGIGATYACVGYKDLLEKGLLWVVVREKYDYYKKPNYDENIIVSTWPHEKGKISFLRDYQIKSVTGELLAKGTSEWVIINLETRRIERASKIDYDGDIIPDMNYPEPCGKLYYDKIDGAQLYTHKVTNSDLDHNGHMNNSKYGEIVFNCLDLSKKEVIKSLEIQFDNECKLNDIIDVYYYKDGEYTIFVGYNNEKKCFAAKALMEVME